MSFSINFHDFSICRPVFLLSRTRSAFLLVLALALPTLQRLLLLHTQQAPLNLQESLALALSIHPAIEIPYPDCQLRPLLHNVSLAINPPPTIICDMPIPAFLRLARFVIVPCPTAREVFSEDADRKGVEMRKRNVRIQLMCYAPSYVSVLSRAPDEERGRGPEEG